MSRKKIVAGNWKMNTTLDEAVTLVRAIQSGVKDTDHVTKILLPPFPFLKTISDLLIEEQYIFTGAQNCSAHEKGAYTGEVSAAMVRSTGCRFVLAGHSERRHYFGENSGQIAMKLRQALDHELTVIYCVGEQLGERKIDRHFSVVKSQLTEVLQGFPAQRVENLIIAYEPVWAIGTGMTATTSQAQEMHAFARGVLSEIFGQEAAAQIPILYGGSCNAQNAPQLFSCPDVDGGLIGGASLKADDYSAIIRAFE
jgi:triosephosphate isomerase (TIM)